MSHTLPDSVRTAFDARVERDDLELPVLPDTAANVLGVCSSDECDVRELASLVERDQALAGRVLSVSNSAAYAPSEPIVSLQQAIARLGLAAICEIAVAVAVRGKVFQVPGFEAEAKQMWRHSAAAGAYAKEIARVARTNVEGAFLCGLLHDVGKPVALGLLVDVCSELDFELDHGAALETIDALHAGIGALTVGKWDLADWIRESAELHHDFTRAEIHRSEVTVTALADHLAHWALGTRDYDRADLEALPEVDALELYEDDIERLLERRDHVVAVAEAFE